jgi:hypothetical protein
MNILNMNWEKVLKVAHEIMELQLFFVLANVNVFFNAIHN